MRKPCSFGVVILLYYAVGIDVRAASPLLPISASSQYDSDQNQEPFQLDTMANSEEVDGTRLGYRSYDSAKGEKVLLTYGRFGSPEKAKAEMQLWLQAAKKTVERVPTKNSSEEVIGERVVAMFANHETGKKYAAVVWTQEPDCFRIHSE